MKVLFTWEVNERLKTYIENHPLKSDSMELLFLKRSMIEKADIEHADEIEATVGWIGGKPYFKEIYKKLPELSLIVNPGVGVERAIPVVRELNQTRNITLCNGHGHTYFTAQHAVGMLLSLSNRLMIHHQFVKKGKWRTGDKEGASLPLKYRKTGLLGYGPVNQYCHQFLKGFDTEIHVLKNTLTEEQTKNPLFYKQDQLHSFLKTIDNLIIAVPLTQKTKRMIGKKELALLGEKALLINVARGAVVKEKALFKVLKKKKIMGAGIDVWYNYAPEANKKGRKYPFNYPFHQLDNVLLSPHRGGSPMSDLTRWDETMEILARFEQGKPLINVVDLEREY